jgi:hypothetical protein
VIWKSDLTRNQKLAVACKTVVASLSLIRTPVKSKHQNKETCNHMSHSNFIFLIALRNHKKKRYLRALNC